MVAPSALYLSEVAKEKMNEWCNRLIIRIVWDELRSSKLKKICILLLLIESSVYAAMEKNCDLLGSHVFKKTVDSPKRCKKMCVDRGDCKGSVFISGWNKCFLKGDIKRKTKVTMISGIKGQPTMRDMDFTGKDDKQISVKKVKKCKESCLSRPQCTGFTFIDGYQTCWLKKTPGKLISKIFFCWVKPR